MGHVWEKKMVYSMGEVREKYGIGIGKVYLIILNIIFQ